MTTLNQNKNKTMYSAEYFKDKRVIVNHLAHSHLNGTKTILTEVSTNESGHIIACTDIQHPEDRNTFLWVNVNCEVTHILEYEGYSVQYTNEKGKNVTMPYNCTKDEIEAGFQLIGHFDVYKKIPVILT